jgi:hypothetical protein
VIRAVDQGGVVAVVGQTFSGIKRTLSASNVKVGIHHINNNIHNLLKSRIEANHLSI